MHPLAGEARLQIGELGDFNLELALQRARPQGEDVEDQLTAIDNAELELFFQITRLRGAQAVVENREGSGVAARDLTHFGDFAAPDKGARVDLLETLGDRTDDECPRAFGQRG